MHYGVRCSGCKVSTPIHGKRFRCLICSNYNLCERCYNGTSSSGSSSSSNAAIGTTTNLHGHHPFVMSEEVGGNEVSVERTMTPLMCTNAGAGAAGATDASAPVRADDTLLNVNDDNGMHPHASSSSSSGSTGQRSTQGSRGQRGRAKNTSSSSSSSSSSASAMGRKGTQGSSGGSRRPSFQNGRLSSSPPPALPSASLGNTLMTSNRILNVNGADNNTIDNASAANASASQSLRKKNAPSNARYGLRNKAGGTASSSSSSSSSSRHHVPDVQGLVAVGMTVASFRAS